MAGNVQFGNPGSFSYYDTFNSWCGDKPKDFFKFARDGLKWTGHYLDSKEIDSSPSFKAAGHFNDAASLFNFPSFIKDLADVDKAWEKGNNWKLSEKLGLTAVHGVGCFKFINKIMKVRNAALMFKLDRAKELGGLVSGYVSTWDALTDWSYALSWQDNRALDADRIEVVSTYRSTKLCLVAYNATNIAFSVLGLAGAYFAIKASAMTMLTISTVGILAGMAKYTYEKIHEHAFQRVLFNDPQGALQMDGRLRPRSFSNYA